ncbi:hypothetical protein ALC62_09074 [Cyphomyrmex costatus]|uniref:Uncharacterized protein n=1 Tax=Cyphomyrmex costatus TaxID=456900 RepID=A0A151IG45_9HYME|nr:hypothetical protein ALC62_09074 [Cyphomyrmex costatus]
MALLINSMNRLPYCSGSQVDIPSTLAPYLTVFAAFAACLRIIASSYCKLVSRINAACGDSGGVAILVTV